MAIILNTKKQKHAFWSEKIKKHGVKSGQVVLAPGETLVENDVLDEVKKDKFFAAMLESGELVVKADKVAAKEQKAKADAEAKALKEAQAAKAKEEAGKVAALKKQLADLGIDGRSLKNLNLVQLEQKLEEATKP
jgi:hypothetical protein